MKLWGKIFFLTMAIGTAMSLALHLGAAGTSGLLDLDAAVARIDHEHGPALDPIREADLSKRFGVPMGRIDMMQADKKGWGTVTAELALAQSLSREQPRDYPTPTDALGKIQWLREGDFKYNEIADKVGNRNEIVDNVNRQDLRRREI